MSKFTDMSSDEQKALCNKIAECLKANDLASVPVSIYTESVAALASDEVEAKTVVKVAKSLPST